MTKTDSSSRIRSIKQAHQLTLVPNQRMFDLQLVSAFQQAGNPEVMVAPALQVFSQWVEQTSVRIDLLRGQAVAVTADRFRLDQLWQQAVGAQSEWVSAFECHTVARSARGAERMLRQWCPEAESPWLSPHFHGWRHKVQASLNSQHMFTAEDWLSHLTLQLAEPGDLPLPLPSKLMLRGFIEVTQLEQSLLDALGQRGVQVVDCSAADSAQETRVTQQPDCQTVNVSRVLHAFDTNSGEIRAAAHWADCCLERGSQRVVVVVNGLAALSAQLVAVFDRVIHPHDGMEVAFTGHCRYHLPDSSALADHAMISTALLLLRMLVRGPTVRLPFPDISQLLLSPCLAGWESEQHARAQLEVKLREEGVYYLSIRHVQLAVARSKLENQLPVLTKMLASAERIGNTSDIPTALFDRLSAWGWPGPLARGPLSLQRLQRFTSLLERLAQAEPLAPQQSVDMLSQWCREARLTERGGPLSPIQILAPEDVIGQRFDAAWVMNVHDGNWPGQAAANAFLPHDMLTHIPRATATGELQYTRRIQSNLDVLAAEVHYSWSNASGDVVRLASPLLIDTSIAEHDHPQVPHWPLLQPSSPTEPLPGYAHHPWLQAISDEQGLPLTQEDGAGLPGGSAMVKQQSACPLSAYLIHRLQARFESMPGPFADSAYRGKLLHQALYHLYEQQPGQAGLPASARINDAVATALSRLRAAQRLEAPAFRAEQLRLQRLLQQWLDLEQQRHGFVVAALEEEHSMEVDGIHISIRLDRVDKLADGRQLIIDYKSGIVDANSWLRQRIGEPQLPLYAVLFEREWPGSIGGLALASVRTGDCHMAGVVDDPQAALKTLYSTGNRRTSFGRNFENWNSLLEHWKSGIGSLLTEITAGYAANCLYDEKGLRYAGLDMVLRRSEGEAWMLAHGAVLQGAVLQDDSDD